MIGASYDITVEYAHANVINSNLLKKLGNLNSVQKEIPSTSNNISTTSLLDLLPQDKETLLNSDNFPVIVQLLTFFIRELKQSLKVFFIDKNYAQFDPHVGDTACHIRAYHILHLSRLSEKKLLLNGVTISKRLNEIEEFGQRLDAWLKTINPRDYKNKKIENFFEAQFINFECSPEELFLLQAHSLSKHVKFSEDSSYTYIDTTEMARNVKLGKNATNLIIQKFQKNIAEFSVDFFLALLGGSSLSYLQFSQQDLASIINYDEYRRKVIPAFIAMEIILENLLKNSISIIFRIQRRVNNTNFDLIDCFFEVNEDQSKFVAQNFKYVDKHSSCYVVYGFADYSSENLVESKEVYLEKFIKCTPEKIMLTNLAAHPQFSSSKFSRFRDECFISCNPSQKLIELKERKFFFTALAEQEGFCLKNSRCFFAQHAFCDTLIQFMSIDNKLIEGFGQNVGLYHGPVQQFLQIQKTE